MIRLQYVLWMLGLVLIMAGLLGVRDRTNSRRWTTGGFWFLLGLLVMLGDLLPPALVGAVVLLLALIAGLGGVKGSSHQSDSSTTGGSDSRRERARRLGHWLLFPALLIPVLTLVGVLGLSRLRVGGRSLLEGGQALTLVSLGVACLGALAAALLVTRESPTRVPHEGRRLLDAIGWAALLPLLLAVLGQVFAAAGVGSAVASLVARLPLESRIAAVLAYGLGMASFTMIMGNAFAAFPVITLGIGIPVLIELHGANPAVLGAVGMLTGYCGTLMTPMAANFNIVPAALLELPDQHAVIKAQIPTALLLLAANLVLMYVLAFE
ncbi:MAG: DUF979 family protein [Pseudomonadota bacterium]